MRKLSNLRSSRNEHVSYNKIGLFQQLQKRSKLNVVGRSYKRHCLMGKWLVIKTNLLKLYNCMLNCVQEKVHCSRGALNWKVELAKISSSFPDDLVLLFLHVHHDLNQRGEEKVQEVIE